MGSRRIALVLIVLFAHGAFTQRVTAAVGTPTFDTVAYTGQQVPGAGAGVTFRHFGRPASLNDHGQIALYSQIQGAGVTFSNDAGIWSGNPNSLGLVVRTGNVAPGQGGATFDNLSNVVSSINAYGQMVFNCSLTSSGDDTSWLASPGSMQLVIRDGDPAPGAGAGVTFVQASASFPNDSGVVRAGGTLTGPGVTTANDSGMWLGGPGSLQLVLRKGDPAPGVGAGVTFAALDAGGITGASEFATHGTLTGPGVTTSNDRGIWAGSAGNLQLLARRGDPAPGTLSPVTFSFLYSDLAMNHLGAVTFSAQLNNTFNIGTDSGIWAGTVGNVQLAVREGDQAPGQPAGIKFGDFTGADPVINGRGHVALRCSVAAGAGVTTSSNTAIAAGAPGAMKMIAREGDHAPGTPAGTLFGDFSTSFGNPALNINGQVAFWDSLTGIGVTSSNDSGIWYTDELGTLQLLLREGDVFDLDDGPGVLLKQISQLTLATQSGGEDGSPSGFNSNGQLAVTLGFIDGTSGIFIAQALPEPSCLSFFALLALPRRRRK